MIRCFFYIGLLTLVTACANRGNITGGDIDETPPQILLSIPENRSVNFNAKSVELNFNENIKLNNLNQQLLISPPFTTNPEIKARGDKLVIEFKEELKENTTYTINFGDALQDLNEGNPIPGFTYVFSTGSEIDSLELAGSMLDARTLKPVENAWALLYKNLADSAISTERPYYIAKVQDDGNFQFSNLGEGEYNVFTLVDNNFNTIYDLPNEKIGFVDETITLPSDSLNVLIIRLFERQETNVFAQEVKELNKGRLLIKGNGNLDTLDLGIVDQNWESWPRYRTNEGDSLFFWRPATKDVERLEIYATQPAYDYNDTLSLRLKETLIVDSSFVLKPSLTGEYDFSAPLELRHHYPITEWPETLSLLEDSLYVAGGVGLSQAKNPSALKLDFPWEYGKEYEVLIPGGSVVDYYNNVNDTLRFNFKTRKKEDFGSLNLKLLNASSLGYTIELLNSSADPKYNKYLIGLTEPYTWENLQPGTYTIRVIIDENGNQRWDSGDYATKTQPEKVLVFKDPIEIRADWAIDLEVDVKWKE